MNNPQRIFRQALIPTLLAGACQLAFAADKVAAPGAMAKPTAAATTSSAVSPHFLRASKLVGMNVEGAEGKNVGEITDLIVNLATGDVRYAIFEYDPSVFKSEKVFAVPIQDMDMSADGKTLSYKQMSRDQLDRAAIDKKDWKTAFDDDRYMQGVDTTYGYTTDMKSSHLARASDVLGMDVNSREGKDIGDIKELVVDMGAGKVRYAVLAFDPSWFKGEKLYAFPLNSFSAASDDDELRLNVGRDKLATMKSIDPQGFDTMADARSIQVNRAVPASN